MEDALKRLDKLTQEEARMAVAQNLKATQMVDERVRGVANTVAAMDDRVAHVDDRVASVDDKVVEVINGAQIIFIQAGETFNLTTQMERKQSKS